MSQTITAGQAFNPFTHFRLRLRGEAIIPQDILNSGIKLPVARTYAVLAQMAGFDGACFPKIQTVAELLGLSYRQVARHIKILITKGLLALRHQRQTNGWFRNSEYFFLWHPSFSAAGNVLPMRAKMSERKDSEKKERTSERQTEQQPRSAERAAPAAERPAVSLEPLRKAMEEAQKDISSEPTMVTTRSAEQMVRRLEDAFQRPVSVQEAVQRVREVWEHGKRLKRWRRRGKSKAWLYVGGMLTFAYNLFAEPERQTYNYRPENDLTAATMTGLPAVAAETWECF